MPTLRNDIENMMRTVGKDKSYGGDETTNRNKCSILVDALGKFPVSHDIFKGWCPYGNAALSLAQVFRWYKAFKDGDETIEHDHRSGRPKIDEGVAKVFCVSTRQRDDTQDDYSMRPA
ncbi:hypothetical protein Trydic_g23690 [Trypoxylus dichotomus]